MSHRPSARSVVLVAATLCAVLAPSAAAFASDAPSAKPERAATGAAPARPTQTPPQEPTKAAE
ncbi:hypothetical protein GT042_21285, partial [Streptomyces sp. SID3212]|nr:hypothetical protein [Streptomyces sp. SID3212]